MGTMEAGSGQAGGVLHSSLFLASINRHMAVGTFLCS